MGGTSTDVSLCQAGEPTIGRETTIGQFRIKVPSVDVHTVGAGGGSIAHVPAAHRRAARRPAVGGRRAGAGGLRRRAATEPTVTDANVVLGHLPARPDRRRDVARRRGGARRGAEDRRRDGPRRSRQAADGILRIVNENMAGALRVDLASSAATTRASSRSSPSAAPARCTPTRSPS